MEEMGLKKRRFNIAQNRELILIALIVVICAVVQLRNSEFLSLTNMMDILKDTSMLIILSIGMMMVMVTRGIDLSIASIMGFTCMAVTMTMADVYPEMPPALAIAMGGAIGLGFGALNGVLIAKGQVLPIIVTMGTMNIFKGMTVLLCGGRQVSSADMNVAFKDIASGSALGINNLIVIAAVVFVLFFLFLNYFKTGKQIYAVGSNPESAKIAGIKTDRIILLVYVLMGLLAGVCGVLWGSRYAYASSASCAGYEMQVIPAVVLGGTSISGGSGKIQGVLLGAILFGIINNSLPMLLISNFWKQAIQGLIILAAILINALIIRQANKRSLRMRGV